MVNLLRQAHHDVVTVNEANLSGSDDTVVLNYARREERLLLTQNCKDFKVLHNSLPKHLGILAVYRENNPSKNITFKAIVKAIANLEESGIPLANQFIVLNQWNY